MGAIIAKHDIMVLSLIQGRIMMETDTHSQAVDSIRHSQKPDSTPKRARLGKSAQKIDNQVSKSKDGLTGGGVGKTAFKNGRLLPFFGFSNSW